MKSALRIYSQKAFIVGIPNRSLYLARYGMVPFHTLPRCFHTTSINSQRRKTNVVCLRKEEDPVKTILCCDWEFTHGTIPYHSFHYNHWGGHLSFEALSNREMPSDHGNFRGNKNWRFCKLCCVVWFGTIPYRRYVILEMKQVKRKNEIKKWILMLIIRDNAGDTGTIQKENVMNTNHLATPSFYG